MNTQFEQLKIQREVIAETEEKLNETNKSLNKVKDDKRNSDNSLREQREKAEKLERENQSLKAELQAKREAKKHTITAAKTKQLTEQKRVTAVAVSGTCEEWIAAAGITDLASAKELIRRESNCNPNAVNPSSGACGVAQELPCGKSGCKLGDGACQVAWMKQYVTSRYGSFANAIAFHNRNNWY